MSTLYDLMTAGFRRLYRLGIRTPPVLDADRFFPAHRLFEAHSAEIRREVLALPGGVAGMPMVHQVLREQTDPFETDAIAWRFVPLHAFGVPHRENRALCPVTSRLLDAVPGLLNATISVLEPGKHLAAHNGPYAGMMRYHLGIVVPPPVPGRPASALRVEGHMLEWREGEGFLFDDSFEHEAWNNAKSPRIVLIVDVTNPTMPGWLRLIDRGMQRLVRALPFACRYMRQGTLGRPAAGTAPSTPDPQPGAAAAAATARL